MNLELFPEVEPSGLDDLLHEIDLALDACFLEEMDAAFDNGSANEAAADAAA